MKQLCLIGLMLWQHGWAQSARPELSEQGLAESFEAQHLPAPQLLAFEARAIEKLTDFLNFLDLIRHEGYEASLRQHAADQALGLFVDSLRQWGGQPVRVRIQQLLQSPAKLEFAPELLEVKVDKSLKTNDQGGYTGRLSYRYLPGRKPPPGLASHGQVWIHLHKVPKLFDDRVNRVWELLLGDAF